MLSVDGITPNMENRRDEIIFFDRLSPDERKRLRAAMEEDADLAEAFAQWQQVRAAVRDRLEAHIPDRHVLVCYALDAEGRGDLLTAAEKRELEAARSDIEWAMQAHPALADVVEQIQEDRAEFETIWEARAGREGGKQPVPERQRADRAPRARHQRQWWGWRVGVGGALVIIAVALLFLLPRETRRVTVEAESGTMRVIELADGSSIRLDGGARLSYARAEDPDAFNRRVTLETGRAFFDVESMAEPFVVETPTAHTRVLGTRFSVQAGTEETNVVLATGEVAVAARQKPGQSVLLKPGQASRVQRGAAPTEPVEVDLNETLAWTGLFIFREVSVGAIAERLSQQYGVAVTVAPALRDEAVTGTFERDRPVQEILNVIATTLDAQVHTEGTDTYRLVPSGDM